MGTGKEHKIQAAYIQWCRWMENTDERYKWVHSSLNGIWLPTDDKELKAKIIAKMKEAGMLNGVSDVFVPYPTKRHYGLYLEFKVGRNDPTVEQRQFLREMRDRGYCAGVVRSVEDAMNLTRTYFSFDVK